ncbi:NADH:flavin oxidoreductase/NADH oxidase family protein [Shewanella sp. HL-SH5]|uniref:NADH:flavin oxidoreductase/NADH oxidase family protein n=1 Tax=Shewanella sp. HL-SH5 TaxID=3436241 RepID=UPI003EB966AF
MSQDLFSAVQITPQTILKNRFVKAAMEENLANNQQLPDEKLFRLYQQWAQGGVGLIITGNVMIDRMAMTGPGGVTLEHDTPLAPFIQWANIAKANNTKVWMQLNHPGRQVFKALGGKSIAPSAISLDLGKHSNLFSIPQAMIEDEIQDVIKRFGQSAYQAQLAGFDGVEIHAAHGYLLAQFLSPLTNQRTDEWGGSLLNRAKLLIEVIKQVRQSCGNDFDVAVKLNSADFQRGGFDIDDAEQVINWLAEYNVNLVELSGGSYEAPAMQGRSADDRTLAREAYFLSFTELLVKRSPIPLMLTGGIQRLPIAQKVIDAGFSICGLATALAYQPDIINRWQTNPEMSVAIKQISWENKTFAALATMAIIKRQLRRMSRGNKPKMNDFPLWSLVLDQIKTKRRTAKYKKYLQAYYLATKNQL